MAGRVAVTSLTCSARSASRPAASAVGIRALHNLRARAFRGATPLSGQSPSSLPSKGLGRGSRDASSLTVAAWGAQAAMTELAPKTPPAGQDIATFAGGCFWGLELAYQREPGVTATSVGYTQGNVEGPSYQAVCSGRTGHTEAVQVYFDPKETDYHRLLDLFFERVDPTTKDRQGNDSGSQYRSGIYYHSEEQKAAAEKAIQAVNEKLQSNTWRRVLGTKVVSELKPAGDYWLAEKYHQHYLQKGGQDASKGATDRIRCYG